MRDDFLEFFPEIVEFLEEKYKIDISVDRDNYPES
jgi:hypothetical protein